LKIELNSLKLALYSYKVGWGMVQLQTEI